jgi:hypothetical protein
MGEITKDFTGYVRENLPKYFDNEEDSTEDKFMTPERLDGIVEEMRGHLQDSPPDFGAVMDMAHELGLTEEAKE